MNKFDSSLFTPLTHSLSLSLSLSLADGQAERKTWPVTRTDFSPPFSTDDETILPEEILSATLHSFPLAFLEILKLVCHRFAVTGFH